MSNPFELLATKLRDYGSDPSETQLIEAARELLSVCEDQRAFLRSFAAAKHGEERLYKLAVISEYTPSIYLVTDGAGVVSPAHEHCTWAVIVGLDGNELNTFFPRQSAGSAVVTPEQSINVGAGEFLTMSAATIHSTATVGNESTFHVHIYGRPLVALPPFASRTFAMQKAT
jgi:predicted metal-dependent enzyme (double-stranded beta helix superfamily)